MCIYVRGCSGELCVVGGHWSEEDDWSMLEPESKYPPEKRAAMTVHMILARVETLQCLYCVDAFPLPVAHTGKATQFIELMGRSAKACCAANSDCPPAGFAVDGGKANVNIVKACLGICRLETITFFSECVAHPMGLRYMPFSQLQYRGHWLACPLDMRHLLKRLAFHAVSSSRSIHVGHTAIDFSGALDNSIPLKAYAFADQQSDQLAQHILNARYLRKSWSAFGAVWLQWLSALLSSVLEGSAGVSAASRVKNGALAYFELLLGLVVCKSIHKASFAKHYLPLVTTRNLCWSVVLGVQVALRQPGTAPSVFAEKAAEFYFCKIKASYRGQPSVRDMLYGSHAAHMRFAGQHMCHLCTKPRS